jgi:GMP synthase (glutamine-hydrolysing)
MLVYCDVKPSYLALRSLSIEPIGIIFTGGPNSVYDDDTRMSILLFLNWDPVLGICYVYISWHRHLAVCFFRGQSAARNTANRKQFDTSCKLFTGLPKRGLWMSHGDVILECRLVSLWRPDFRCPTR